VEGDMRNDLIVKRFYGDFTKRKKEEETGVSVVTSLSLSSLLLRRDEEASQTSDVEVGVEVRVPGGTPGSAEAGGERTFIEIRRGELRARVQISPWWNVRGERRSGREKRRGLLRSD